MEVVDEGHDEHTKNVTDQGEKSDEDVVNHVDVVSMLRTAGDPADEEEHPDETECGD